MPHWSLFHRYFASLTHAKLEAVGNRGREPSIHTRPMWFHARPTNCVLNFETRSSVQPRAIEATGHQITHDQCDFTPGQSCGRIRRPKGLEDAWRGGGVWWGNDKVAWCYDIIGKLTWYYDIIGKLTGYYDIIGKLTWNYDIIGKLTWNYDIIGKLTWYYDTIGKLTGYYDIIGKLTWNYDIIGKLTWNYDIIGKLTWYYDTIGKLTWYYDIIGKLRWYYDLIGKLTDIVT
jgi:hypothetical protein